jgi:hypothetical protein
MPAATYNTDEAPGMQLNGDGSWTISINNAQRQYLMDVLGREARFNDNPHLRQESEFWVRTLKGLPTEDPTGKQVHGFCL